MDTWEEDFLDDSAMEMKRDDKLLATVYRTNDGTWDVEDASGFVRASGLDLKAAKSRAVELFATEAPKERP